MAQRAQRQCTSYYCGYSFKVQPVGKKQLRLATDSLNYLEESLAKKSILQKWHRITHPVLVDLQHRCMRRTALEESNLGNEFSSTGHNES
eukprot:7093088-Karenia_brevis.AAC.1